MKEQEELRYVATGITWNQLMEHWEVISHDPKPRFRSGIRHCYLCKRERGETSLHVLGKREGFAFGRIRLNFVEVDVDTGTNWSKFGFYLCDECCILLKLFSGVTASQLIPNKDLPGQKLTVKEWTDWRR